jgi:Cu(I)/Ag(I) efflux system periplasmic protein CusF
MAGIDDACRHMAQVTNRNTIQGLTMKPFRLAVCSMTVLLSVGVLGVSMAQDKAAGAGTPASNAAVSVAMTDGEVRKIDKESRKITLKHSEIKNLDMPAMTMVFQVKDSAILDKVQVGDKVKFKAEKTGGGIVVTEIAASPPK